MAREPSVLDDDAGTVDDDVDTPVASNRSLLDRRSYLKMAGMATAGAAASAATATASTTDFEVIKIPAGQRKVVRLGSNETYENVLFDQTAPGSAASIIAMGTNWTIRNVGWKGEFSHHDRAIAVADTGKGTSRVQNLYMGDGVDGSVGDRRHPKFGLWVSPDHNGHLQIENMYVEGAHDNAFYGSAPGSNGNGKRGTIHYKNCFAKDCWVSGFRISRGKVEDCTAINTSAGRNGRPVWVWPTDYHNDPVEITGCNFVSGGYPYAMNFGRRGRRTDINMEGTHWSGPVERRGTVNLDRGPGCGNNPDPSVPDGIPTSAEEAAAGDGDYEIVPTYSYAMRFDGDGAYFFRTEGGSVEGTDEKDCVEGTLDGESVEIGYNTFLKNVGVTDGVEARILVNGNEYEPTWSMYDGPETEDWLESELWNEDAEEEAEPEEEEQEEPELENVIVIEGAESGVTRYEFVVGGEIEKANYEGASIDDEDLIDGSSVHGVTANWKDAFRFGGDLEQLTVDGPGTVYVNDEAVDPDDFGEELPHVLEVVGDGSLASFEITIDGTVEYDGDENDDGVSIISGTTIQSSIAEGTQTFNFSGAVTDVTFVDGAARVFVDGEELDVETGGDQELLPHAIVIDGTEADGPSTYSFTVDGKVIQSEFMDASIDPEDVIEGRAVRGGLGNWLDAFWFSGSVTDFKLVGDARVHVVYNAREQ